MMISLSGSQARAGPGRQPRRAAGTENKARGAGFVHFFAGSLCRRLTSRAHRAVTSPWQSPYQLEVLAEEAIGRNSIFIYYCDAPSPIHIAQVFHLMIPGRPRGDINLNSVNPGQKCPNLNNLNNNYQDS